MATWTRSDAAHLLRRTGFGGDEQQIDQFHALGQEAAIDTLIEYEAVPDPSAQAVTGLGIDATQGMGVMQAQLYRMAASPRPLQEKLTWFWHGHFVSALGKSPAALMPIQMDTWRAHANGDFREFLYAMYTDPAMLIYLDNNTNVVGQPNENFAREVLELFTLGIGHYSEDDIKEAARALTGWIVPLTARTTSLFVPRRHDDGVKTVLGITGNLDGDDLMDILFAHPATAQRICARLYQFFVKPEVDAAELDALLAAWNGSNGRIKDVLHTLFRLDGFWAETTRGALIKSPVEYGIGLYQRLRVPLTADSLRTLAGALIGMGQTPLMPPDVSGYPAGLEWAGTSTLLTRYNSAYQLLYGNASIALLTTFLQGLDTSTSRRLLDGLLQRLGPLELGATSDGAVLAYLDAGGYSNRNSSRLINKTRGALHLIASTPEYQVN